MIVYKAKKIYKWEFVFVFNNVATLTAAYTKNKIG